MLGHLVQRLQVVSGIDDIVVATTTNPGDNEIVSFCESSGIHFFRGSEDDVLGRVNQAAQHHGASAVVAITGDCPIIDPKLVEQVVKSYRQSSYDLVSNGLKRTFPIGMDSNVVSVLALEAAATEATEALDREHVLRFIYRRPERFTAMNIESPAHLFWPELGLTLDEPADYELISFLIEHLYPTNPHFSCDDIVSLVRQRPDLAQINQHVVRKGDS